MGFFKIPRWKEKEESQNSGDVENDSNNGENKRYNTLTEFFYDFLLPLGLTYGMSNKEFWEEEPELLWAYRKSYIDQLKMQNEIINYKAWLNGLYVFDAISKSIYNSFGRKESQQALNYIAKPYDLNEKTKTPEEIQKEEQLKLEEQIKESLQRTKNILKQNKERQEK